MNEVNVDAHNGQLGSSSDQFYNAQINALITFCVPTRYQNLILINSAPFSTVCGAYDTLMNRRVAIKRIMNISCFERLAKLAYREFSITKRMEHPNVIGLYDAFISKCKTSQSAELYLVMELMDGTMKVLISRQFTHIQLSHLLYQLLSGIKYLHSCGIIHRDLKPSNIGFLTNGSLKILDLGLARKFTYEMSNYVCTRPYRAPEIILMMEYTELCDVWSVGCIFGEMLRNALVFGAYEHPIQQWFKIVEQLGVPGHEFMSRMSPKILKLLEKVVPSKKFTFEELFPDSLFPADDPDEPNWSTKTARDLLRRMLVIDPIHRITVAQALDHPYLIQWRRENDDIPALPINDPVLNEDQNFPTQLWLGILAAEVAMYRVELDENLKLVNTTGNNEQEENSENSSYFDYEFQEYYDFKAGLYHDSSKKYWFNPKTLKFFHSKNTTSSDQTDLISIDDDFVKFFLGIKKKLISPPKASS